MSFDWNDWHKVKKLEEEMAKNSCCEDFRSRIRTLFSITPDGKRHTLELIDGCENDYQEFIKFCPFCGSELEND